MEKLPLRLKKSQVVREAFFSYGPKEVICSSTGPILGCMEINNSGVRPWGGKVPHDYFGRDETDPVAQPHLEFPREEEKGGERSGGDRTCRGGKTIVHILTSPLVENLVPREGRRLRRSPTVRRHTARER